MPLCDCIPGVLLRAGRPIVLLRCSAPQVKVAPSQACRPAGRTKPGMPARPSVVAATKNDSGVIGT